jgi:hypothetical protein
MNMIKTLALAAILSLAPAALLAQDETLTRDDVQAFLEFLAGPGADNDEEAEKVFSAHRISRERFIRVSDKIMFIYFEKDQAKANGGTGEGLPWPKETTVGRVPVTEADVKVFEESEAEIVQALDNYAQKMPAEE